MEYRLRAQLEAVRRGVLEREALVLPASLSPADRDILRDALRIVRQFRETLRTRYKLAAFWMSRGALRRLFYKASLGDHAYKFLFEPGPEDEVVALDCETTGLNPRRDDIVAVAAVRIRGNRILTSERFEAFVRPEDSQAGADSIKVHQMRQRTWRVRCRCGSPARPAALHRRPAAGRLLHRFRRPHAGQVCDGPDRGEAAQPADRGQRAVLRPKYGNAPPGTVFDLRFDNILKDLGIPPLAAHDALNDAVMAGMAYLALRDMKARGVRIWRERIGQGLPPPTGG